MRFYTLLPVFLVAACETGQTTESIVKSLDSVVHSGSRIDLRVNTLTVQSADGMNYTLRPEPTYYDKLLAHPCVLEQNAIGWKCQPASDATIDGTYPGHTYPLPTGESPGYIFSTTMLPYADSACSRLVAALYDPGRATPTAGLLARSLNDPDTIYTLGHELSYGAPLYYKRPGGSCNPAGGYPGITWRIFDVGPTVSSTFVGVTKGVEVLP